MKKLYLQLLIVFPAFIYGMNGYATNCPAGYYPNSEGTCTICPQSYYCHDDAKYSCLFGETTTRLGSVDRSECVCRKGFYYNMSISLCSQCPIGTYSDSYDSSSCTACPDGMLTPRVGSDDISDCYYVPAECDWGQGYYNGSCSSCPRGTYKNWTGNDECSACPANSTTKSTGSTSLSSCICDEGYSMENGNCVASLCTYGATKLYVGNQSYNLHPSCTSPALHIGLSAGVCCVNLESGTKSGGVNVLYNGTSWHAID